MNILKKLFSFFAMNKTSKITKTTKFKAKTGFVYLGHNKLEYSIHEIKDNQATYTVKHPSGNVTTSSTDLVFFEDLKEVGEFPLATLT